MISRSVLIPVILKYGSVSQFCIQHNGYSKISSQNVDFLSVWIIVSLQWHHMSIMASKSPATRVFVEQPVRNYIKKLSNLLFVVGIHLWPVMLLTHRASNVESVSLSWICHVIDVLVRFIKPHNIVVIISTVAPTPSVYYITHPRRQCRSINAVQLMSFVVLTNVKYCITHLICHFASSDLAHSKLCVSYVMLCVMPQTILFHDDVIKWKHFPRYWPFVRGVHRSPVNSPHKGQWRDAFMFSLIYARLNGWVNTGEAGDLRRYRAHDDVTVMHISCHLIPQTLAHCGLVTPYGDIDLD